MEYNNVKKPDSSIIDEISDVMFQFLPDSYLSNVMFFIL